MEVVGNVFAVLTSIPSNAISMNFGMLAYY